MSAYLLTPLLQALFCGVLTGIVLASPPRDTPRLLFSVFLLSLTVWGVVIYGMRSSPDAAAAMNWERWTVPLQPLVATLFLQFCMSFSRGARGMRLTAPFHALSALCLWLSRTELVFTSMREHSGRFSPNMGPLGLPWMVVPLAAYLVSVWLLARLARGADSADQRNRARYIVAGVVLFLVGGLLDALVASGVAVFPGYVIGIILFCLLTALAILRHNLLDIEIVFRKAAAYLLMSALLAFPVLAVLVPLSRAYPGRANLAWISLALVLGLSFCVPALWRAAQRQVDRWFYRDRYESLLALELLSEESEPLDASLGLPARVVRLLAGALQVSDVHLLQRSSPDKPFAVVASSGDASTRNVGAASFGAEEALARWLATQGGVLATRVLDTVPRLRSLSAHERRSFEILRAEAMVPLKTQEGQLLAILTVGRKRSGRPLSEHDLRLLGRVTTQLATRMENALLFAASQAARANLQAWFHTMSDSVIISDPDLRVTFMNRAAFQAFGGGVRGNLLALLRWHDSEAERGLASLLARGEGGMQFTHSLEGRHYDIAAAAMSDPSGSPSAILVLRDITERVATGQRLQEAERRMLLSSRLAAIGEMASGIAHEVNNPLTSVIGFAELLTLYDVPAQAREDLRMVLEGARRAADVVSRLLTFARQQKPRKEQVDINEILRASIALRQYSFGIAGIRVELALDPGIPRTMADAGQLQQVFLNIIINAEREMSAAHGGGTIRVSSRLEGGMIVTAFADDGPGLAPEIAERIFDPFFTTQRHGEGSGLGLSVSHGIISEHRGKIAAANNETGGATFTVEIPLVSAAEAMTAAAATGAAPSQIKGRVLVVDDEELIRLLVRRLLTADGHEVLTASSSEQALSMLQLQHFHAVLLDIRMPGMGGIELYTRLSSTDAPLAKRILFVTGDNLDERTRRFLDESGAPCVAKPFTAQQLRQALRPLLRRE